MPRFRIPSTSPFYIVMLGLLSALPPLATDIGLPAIPALQAAFHVGIGTATHTLTVFLAGFSVGPVLFGPLSDRYGRKPVLLSGLALFALTAFACAAANDIAALLLVRFVQGIAAGAAAALPAAIVRDVFSGHVALSRQSYVALVNAVAPLVAPLIGAGILQLGDWRLIYACLGAIGCALLLLGFLGYEETRPQAAAARAAGGVFGTAFAAYRQVLGNRHYLIHAALLAASFGTMFAYITGSSAVFIDQLGVSGAAYGGLFALTAAGTIAGAATGERLARARGAHRPLVGSVVGSAIVNVLLLAAAVLGTTSIPLIAACVVASNFCAGIVMPNATHQALDTVGHVAGSAAALLRSMQMLAGAGTGALVGLLAGNRLTAMAGVMTLAALAGLVLLRARRVNGVRSARVAS